MRRDFSAADTNNIPVIERLKQRARLLGEERKVREDGSVLRVQVLQRAGPDATAANLSLPRVGPTNAGRYFLRSKNLGGTVDSIEAVLTVTQRPFDAWRIRHFGESAFVDPLKENIWGTLADPDHDGYANLSEYAFGGAPLTPDAGMLIEVVDGRLHVAYARRKGDPDIQITPEISTDLAQWQGGPGYVEEVAVNPIRPASTG